MRYGMRIMVLASLLVAGCASLDPHGSRHLVSDSQVLRDCAEWFRELDARVDAAGVRDAQDARVPGFPYLRVNRLLASFRQAAVADERVMYDLVDRMHELDLQARRHESANLPIEGTGSDDRFGARVVVQRASGCGAVLRDADLADASTRARLLASAVVPDDYSSAGRVLGLYVLARVPFAQGVRRYHDAVRAAFAAELRAPPGGSVVRYSPPPPPAALRLPRAALAKVIEYASVNPLGMPEPRDRELDALFAAHAPSFEVEITGDHDRFGALRWLRGAPTPDVDAAQPVVYRNLAWTRYRGRVLLQLVYTIWFPERPPLSPGDILAGRLDGITWRVTLAPDGEPLVYDTMHPCGCYHMFFPTPRARPLPAPAGEVEWMFSPQSLPRIADGERPVLRIATRTHYVERVLVARGTDSLVRYELRSYDELRSIRRLDGRRSSVFGPDGLIAGTERAERFVFWPMGIPSAGAMRQWGRHATAFTGRRHFDDADLMERRFEFELG
ncbi:MAG: hypothetical protein AB7O31_16975 [Burkholderiales bacterium]